jgi:hypothetical protein
MAFVSSNYTLSTVMGAVAVVMGNYCKFTRTRGAIDIEMLLPALIVGKALTMLVRCYIIA